ncbi:hypothetical protein GCM10010330_15990 [Streptomyces tendae]|uniref:helix-turn-helix domain-containing protein n=1 Tax=Streptomyces tendae TaxID=1932 RepID=UPI001677FBB4|nr:helix-turn-helix transcriptional regulator [Streptomyces tendae]GHA63976.1 hypothetical protein GCM10010330_15990 [Streptomyces tendae]
MHSTPSDVIAAQVRKRRRQLDLNRQQLADKCASIGAAQITTAALTNIETGRPDKSGKRRREVTVEELLALSHALSTNPVDLMVPADADDEDPYEVTPELTTTSATARDWISGTAFLVPPESPMDFAIAIQAMPTERAQEVSRAWFTPERQSAWNRAALQYEREQAASREDS